VIIEADNLDDLYREAISKTLSSGRRSFPRGLGSVEITAVRLELPPQSRVPVVRNLGRKLNYAFGAVETVQYLDGDFDLNRLAHYNRRAPELMTEEGAYGPRISVPLWACVAKLKKDRWSRQAVIPVHRTSDLSADSDVPCTLSLQFLLRGEALDLIATMRSNDLAWGFPYDAMAFCFLQHVAAAALSVAPGRYVHQVGSLHAYDSTSPLLTKTAESADGDGPDYGTADRLDETFARSAAEEFLKRERTSRVGLPVESHGLPDPFGKMLEQVAEWNLRRRERDAANS